MKPLAFITFLLCLALQCRAGEILWPNASNLAFTNTVFSLSLTNSSATNVLVTLRSIQHTFDNFYTVTGTNTCTNYVDFTTDPSLSQWINYTSYTYTASGSAEFTLTGKHVAFQFRTTMLGTNAAATNTWFYMGQ